MTVKNISDMEEEFKSLQEYSDNQFHTIVSLKKQLDEALAQNNAMRVALEKKPKDTQELVRHIPNIDPSGISNEQLICEVQIALIKEKAITRDLSFEETRQFVALTDTLLKLQQQKKTVENVNVKNISDDELLRLVSVNGLAVTNGSTAS